MTMTGVLPQLRYTYLGDKLTRPDLRGMQYDPVRRADGKCVISAKLATALVVDPDGNRHVGSPAASTVEQE